MLNLRPVLHPFWYWMVTDVLIDVIVPVVIPVVRPLLITGSPIVGAWIVVHGTPISRIEPVESTFDRAVERPTSTFPVPRGTRFPMKSPTMLSPVPEQFESMSPGCSVS